jgi:hypothetical protein
MTTANLTKFVSNLKWPALISAALVLPLMILEWVNRRAFHEGFPIPLFTTLWLLLVVFMLILRPILRNVRAGNRSMGNPLILALKVVILLLIAWLWISILMDQMPCFLGVPSCD